MRRVSWLSSSRRTAIHEAIMAAIGIHSAANKPTVCKAVATSPTANAGSAKKTAGTTQMTNQARANACRVPSSRSRTSDASSQDRQRTPTASAIPRKLEPGRAPGSGAAHPPELLLQPWHSFDHVAAEGAQAEMSHQTVVADEGEGLSEPPHRGRIRLARGGSRQ